MFRTSVRRRTKSTSRRNRILGILLLGAVGLAVTRGSSALVGGREDGVSGTPAFSGLQSGGGMRHLFSEEANLTVSHNECAGELVREELPDWEMHGGAILWLILILYLFLGIAIVCDDYFVSALETICEKLNLSEDVAGATFMAAGSSAPELFSSTMSIVTGAGNEIGIGTIVGSAIFNVLVIVGVTAACAGTELKLDWKPVIRDVIFYFAAIMTIMIFFYDGTIWWWEGLISVFLYMLYVTFMYYNERVMNWIDSKSGSKKPEASNGGASGNTVHPEPPALEKASPETPVKLPADAPTNVDNNAPVNAGSRPSSAAGAVAPLHAPLAGGEKSTAEGTAADDVEAPKASKLGEANSGDEQGGEDGDDGSPFDVPETLSAYPMWLLSLPWYTAFYWTIPDCKAEGKEKFFLVSFFMSVLWIMAFSYFMVEWAARLGCVIDAPIILMGNILLAAGTSIPDAMSSVAVAQQGMGDMAVANAIGSNVFDIWLGLGLPWLILLPILEEGRIAIDVSQLYPNIGILLGVLLAYVLLLGASGWTLTPRVGRMLMALYVLYIIWNIVGVWQLKVFGDPSD